ncbi:MAG: hypothetical protein DID90_2727553161 [Candidatus Nitrotoga sp. LAW]|nr:MAG: hypothetical protein DID90_2727553161 [Candidatus Nitrotoga sp. LAW]
MKAAVVESFEYPPRLTPQQAHRIDVRLATSSLPYICRPAGEYHA